MPIRVKREVKRANEDVKSIAKKQYKCAILQVEFEWDPEKETLNLAKHGVSFLEAQSASPDPLRVIAADEAHSKKEPPLLRIGRSKRGIVTVRFIRRGDRIRIIGAGSWRKGKQLYAKTNR
jgi:uncharacterized DUF497 family protein